MRHHSKYLRILEGRTPQLSFMERRGTRILEITCPGRYVQKNQGIILSNVPGKSLGLNFRLQDVCCSSQRSDLTTFIKLQSCLSFVIRRWYELKAFLFWSQCRLELKTSKEIKVTKNIEQKKSNKHSLPLRGPITLFDTTQKWTIC